jgi:hypothetical protein
LACVAALAGAFVAQLADAQYAKKRKPDTGPRAVGLLKIDAKGGAQLIPIVIRIDGKFYDAGAYKADPVPMALQPETVYEGLKSGVSQGLFTTAGAGHAPEGWFADGKWRTTAQIEAAKVRSKAESDKKAQKASEDPINSGPPRLRHPGDAPPPSSSAATPDANKTPPATPTPAGSANPTPSPSPSPSAKDSTAKAPAQQDSAQADSGRPVLHRQEPSETSHEQTRADSGRPVLRRQEPSETSHEQTKVTSEAMSGPFVWVPAISAAGGPDPRPYSYQMKPEDEAAFLKKMLAMAAAEVSDRAEGLGKGKGEESKSKASNRPARSKAEGSVRSTLKPEFQDVQLHVFDLSNSNEPVLILTANATVPSHADLVFTIALVARQDIYGELHKVSAQVTDTQHLDVLPKYEFIDAVDVDGDGRAELLFRLTSDAGTAYAIYSVIGDKLWPLFEGKPGT